MPVFAAILSRLTLGLEEPGVLDTVGGVRDMAAGGFGFRTRVRGALAVKMRSISANKGQEKRDAAHPLGGF